VQRQTTSEQGLRVWAKHYINTCLLHNKKPIVMTDWLF